MDTPKTPTYVSLNETDDWELTFEDSQDIRGYKVLGQDGNVTGHTVSDLLIDTDNERVAMIATSDGKEYPAHDVSIGDGVVYVTGDYAVNEDHVVRRATEIERYGEVRRRTI
ncbi:MAG TPA: PRC-barrel domain containing protein [Bacteroidetes bacterium]|nr:PRC-barrel domain containing protein [Bacteroidota bacterium]HIL56716.1 PRC-barrel domain containing protein [Rhodothermales bacterium]